MKRAFIAIIPIITGVLLSVGVYAQAPERISYQAIIRNSSNELVKSLPVGLQVSILQGSATGRTVFSETHSAMTNINGLFTIEIGGGPILLAAPHTQSNR